MTIYTGYYQPVNKEPGKERPMYEQLVVPKAMVPGLLKLAHRGPMAGHFGHGKLFETIKRVFYWPNYYADIKRHCPECETCAKFNEGGSRRAGLIPLPPTAPWSRIEIYPNCHTKLLEFFGRERRPTIGDYLGW